MLQPSTQRHSLQSCKGKSSTIVHYLLNYPNFLTVTFILEHQSLADQLNHHPSLMSFLRIEAMAKLRPWSMTTKYASRPKGWEVLRLALVGVSEGFLQIC